MTRTDAHQDLPGQDQHVLTVDEAARILRISRGLAFAAVRAGTLPHRRIGRRILIPRPALEAYLGIAISTEVLTEDPPPIAANLDTRPQAREISTVKQPKPSDTELHELARRLRALIDVLPRANEAGRP